MATAKERKQEEAREELRKLVKPGDTLTTVIRHVSSSGMYRAIDVYKLGPCSADGRVERAWLSRLVARAGIGRFDERREAVGVGGAGMDMGFHIVYKLGWLLFRDERWRCAGKRCPHNSHNNPPYPRRDRRRFHEGGGYSLRQEWLR